MDNGFNDLLNFLKDSLVRRGFAITAAIDTNPEDLPVRNGIRPDVTATLKNVKTVYGKVELPESNFSTEQWDRLRALSADSSITLYVAFPEAEKMNFILSLINGKLAERQNIFRIYMGKETF